VFIGNATSPAPGINEGKLAGGITGVFNPVVTPDGSKVVAAAWTGFNVAELAEFSAQTGRLLAVVMPAAHMPGSGNPCQVLWTDLSGAHLIAYCDTGGWSTAPVSPRLTCTFPIPPASISTRPSSGSPQIMS